MTRTIAFETDRDGNFEVYAMNADGADQTNLSNNAASDRDPAWSPDGSKIAFESDRDGNFEIYVMNADGSHEQRGGRLCSRVGLKRNKDRLQIQP